MTCSNIGVSRKQRVFAVLEDVCGTLKFPSDTDYIRPAGNAVMNQNPEFTDSEELADTLDTMDRFQNATPAGEFELPTYIRPAATLGSVPQGDALFQSLQGSRNSATLASLSANISAAGTTVTFDTFTGGELPERGVIEIGSEQIYYSTLTQGSGATTGTLSGCTRGYNSTSAATHATDSDITLKSVFYKQDTDSPSFSLWIETDHFTQGLSGCSVNQAVLAVNNEGGVMITWTGQGMQMVWAGTDNLQANVGASVTTITVADGDRFEEGAFIQNETKDHNNSGSGYEITTISGNTIILGTATEGAWATDDVIKGYLPAASAKGSPIESRLTTVELAGVDAQFKSGDFTFDAPKNYIADEVGTSYPEAYVEGGRSITSELGLYFRQADAKYFSEGKSGTEIVIELVFGNAGSRMAIYMKRCIIEFPKINFSDPVVELNMPIKALGTAGEDSCEIRFE